MKTRLMRTVPALLLLVVFGLAACGSALSADGKGSGFTDDVAAQTVEVRADPSGRLAWERAEYTATAGDVTFVVSSPQGIAHNFVVTGAGVKAQSKTFGGSTTNRFTLKGLAPGTYTIACTLPGHSEGGMVAALIVR